MIFLQYEKPPAGGQAAGAALRCCDPAAVFLSSIAVPLIRRAKDYPPVAGPPKLRFFAAAPIVLPGGQRLGAL